MDTRAQLNVREPRRSRLPALALAALLAVVVSGAVVYAVRGETTTEFVPVEVAELAPADTHFFLTFNTDLASEPWLAMPRLLNALGIEEQVRADLEESAAEEDLDYDDDILPALASIRRIGLAVQYVSPDEVEAVGVVDSRDRDRVLALLEDGRGPDAVHSEERNEDLGLDFDVYTLDGEPTSAVTVHNDLIYMGESPEHVSNFIQRQQDQAPLSESERFQAAIDDVTPNALVVGYGSGSLLDHSDFRDIVDAFATSSEVDPREATLAFAVTAQDSGWGARAVMRLESGFGTLDQTVAESADISTVAELTPEDALVLFAGSGLHDALDETLTQLERDTPQLRDQFVTPFESVLGLSLETDLLPLLGSTYSIAVGAEDFDADSFDDAAPWVLGLIESTDAPTLNDHLDVIIDTIEQQCLCETGVVIGNEAEYATAQWPVGPLPDGSLADSTGFNESLALLPSNPSALLFLNPRALPEDVVEEWSAEAASDPEGYDVNLDALLGFAVAVAGDDTSVEFDMVMPIDTSAAD